LRAPTPSFTRTSSTWWTSGRTPATDAEATSLLTTVLATYGPDVEYALAVGRENMAAVALYRSLGFVETGGFIMTRAPGLTA